MKKGWICIIVTLVLITFILPALAVNYCPYCGTFLNNDYLFCPQCGKAVSEATVPAATQAPSVAKDLRIYSAAAQSNGNVVIRWEDANNASPYNVYMTYAVSDDPLCTAQKEQLTLPCGSTPACNYTLEGIIPGNPYWITVEDRNGHTAYYKYESEQNRFSEFGVSLEILLKVKEGAKTTKPVAFSAAQIAEGTRDFGSYVKFIHSRLKTARHYYALIAITDPNGVPLPAMAGDIELPSGDSYSYINFFNMNDYFANVKKQYGYIPTGDYTWSVYFDGLFVNSFSFHVSN